MDHEAVQQALGAYALNAVEADEAASVELHLHDCTECQAEHHQHVEVAAMLSVTERSAPSEIWDSIADELRREPPLEDREDPAVAPVIPLRRTWLRPMAAAAAFVLIAGAAVVQSVRLNAVSSDLSAERAAVAALNEELNRPLDVAVADALSNPTAQQVSLTSDASAAGAIIVLMPDGTGYLAEHTLAPLPTDRTYQLWALVDGKVISAGVLGSDPGVVPFHIDPDGFEGFAITEEVIGGVEASENAPVVVGLAA